MKSKSHKILDSVHKQKLEAGLKPFKLVKYFTFSSLGFVLVFTFILSWIISNQSRDVMLKQSEEYSLLIAENLNQQVFRRFVLEAVVRYGGITLRNPVQFDHLDKIVKGVTQGLNIVSVTIYDSKKNIISYSTVDELVGKENIGGNEYHKSLQGEANSTISYSGRLAVFLPDDNVSCILKTFIPFRQVKQSGESGEFIMGVIEITKDLSKEYSVILNLQRKIILVSSSMMAVLFLVLNFIVSRAGKRIEKRAMERLKLEEKLHQTERLAHLGSMVATVSHEIKSPLGIVRSTAEILVNRVKKVAPGSENLAQIIVTETMRLNNIVMEFLDFARPPEATFQEKDVNEIIKRALIFIKPQISEQKAEVIMDLSAEDVKARVDEEQLYRALLNILVNGMQAIGSGGIIQVGTRGGAQKEKLEIYIRDNGCGMAEEKCAQIFKPFFTDKNKGTGLGLAIVKNIIEAHDGQIDVTSVVDQGTTFTITLPRI